MMFDIFANSATEDNWFRRIFKRKLPSETSISSKTIVASGPTTVLYERLDRDVALCLSTTGIVQDDPETVVEVKVVIKDADTLRQLSALCLNAVQRLEPPYFSESDIGVLWEDENPDIYEDSRAVLGDLAEEWLHTPNPHFGMKTPVEIIQSGKTYWVRDVLRRIRTGGFT